MVRHMSIHYNTNPGSILLAIGLFVLVSALVVLCAKQARKISKKHLDQSNGSNEVNDPNLVPKLPLRSPRQLMVKVSNKATAFIHHHGRAEDETQAEKGFGEGYLWQKTILMGEKCQPLKFPGVIYYDNNGNRISEFPARSPRVSPVHSFSFPATEVTK
ncbi:hypothetical protein NMG60_11036073 [Bertholletia excelsa]